MRSRHAISLLALVAFVASCDDDDEPTGITNPAFLRVVNASAATATVDVVVDDRVVAEDVSFGAASEQCVRIPSGAQTVTLRTDGETVATVDEEFTIGDDYFLMLFGATAEDIGATVISEETVEGPGTGRAYVRFANATDVTGQIYLTTPTGELGALPHMFAEPGDITAFGDVEVTRTRARFYEGTTSPPPDEPLADVTIGTLPTSRKGTIVFTGEAEGLAGTGFFVPSCR